MIVYTFQRAEGFYPLVLGSDEEAVANAKCNPGTLRVTNEITGKDVWPTLEWPTCPTCGLSIPMGNDAPCNCPTPTPETP